MRAKRVQKLPEPECHEQDVTKRECKIIDKEMHELGKIGEYLIVRFAE